MEPLDPHPPAPVRPDRPIQLTVTDDLARSRVTVFFRLILAIPHLFWLTLWGIAAFAAAFVVWLAILFEGRAPRVLHDFIASYVRYWTHVMAYLNFLANPYPGFTGADLYPVDVTIAPAVGQSRKSAAVRIVLALPALLLTSALAGGPLSGVATAAALHSRASINVGGVLFMIGLLGWFACLVRGRMPQGLRDLGTYAVGYGAQATGYLLLVTDRYPTSDPAAVEPAQELPAHPVRIAVTGAHSRSRLTVFFRLLLFIPHLVWLLLWTVLVVVAAPITWIVALVIGRVPLALHRFLAAYIRYVAHIYAFLFLVGGPFPGFVGAAGSYPVDIEIDRPVAQRRLVTLARILLVVPAWLVAAALGTVLYVVGFLAWWYAIFKGRMPLGLRNLGAACIRYNAQTSAYLLLLTPRYPYAAPVLFDRPRPDDEPALVPAGVIPPDLEGGAEAEPV